MYYDIGVVSYTPRKDKDTSDPYDVGEIVPLIMGISKLNEYDWLIAWLENSIEGLKVGDAVAFDPILNVMIGLKIVEGLGVRVNDDVYDKIERRASIPF